MCKVLDLKSRVRSGLEWSIVMESFRLARGPGPVGAVDFRVHGVVGVAGGEDAVVGVGEDGGQRLGGALPRPVEHLRLELGELVLEVGEVVGEGLDDGWVPGSGHGFVGRSEILGPLQS